ncbi:gliding motility-associated ABC transporter ATP-binding subunit GldA [Flexithrix dorotheae]|uniref:gliding motility-associated ABC transporter ATP-binding subunit GldA n=1 Tax=Flexithrix dorotheae TaxID=70993 RepID=UPI00035EE9D3|nr:gliding motility-associated ABC transporter ATP-binding subunit GldA [Flexithrix dorotheae]
MSIKVTNLVKQYGTQKAVNNISFEAKEGEILGFLGPNGAGKSTTMKIATCYLPPTEGQIEVCGYKVTESPIEVRKNVGYLPEHNPLYLDMYVQEYLGFIASLHKITGKNAKSRVSDMIELVGLTREQNKKIGALSKGYRQRVGLAQALVHDPKVLILDEPTTGLDPNQILEIRNVIKSISKEKTVVFSTHIMQEVQALCDRVIIINLGQIVADNNVNQLKTETQNETRISLEFESPATIEIFSQLEGVEKVENLAENKFMIITNSQKDIRADIFRLSVEKNLVLIGMHQEEVSLENVFQHLTQ